MFGLEPKKFGKTRVYSSTFKQKSTITEEWTLYRFLKRKGGSLTQNIKLTNSVWFSNYVSDLSVNNKEKILFITLKTFVPRVRPPLRGWWAGWITNESQCQPKRQHKIILSTKKLFNHLIHVANDQTPRILLSLQKKIVKPANTKAQYWT